MTLAENVQEEKEKELGKSFKEILVDVLNKEEDEPQEEGEEVVEEEEDIEDQEYPGRERAPEGEPQVEGVGQELDSDELVREYRDLGEDDETRELREAAEEERLRKKAIEKAKQAKKDLAAKKKRLGVTSVEDEYENALEEAEDINDAIDEELDYDPDEGPLPLTKDNLLDTIGAIDPRLGIAVAGIRGVEAALNQKGSSVDKMKAFGKTLGYGAVNSVLGQFGIQMSPEEWEDATNKINHGLEYVFAPGIAAEKDRKFAQEAGQRAAEAQALQAQTKNVYTKFQKQAEISDKEAKDFEALVDAVDEGYASPEQQSKYNDIVSAWNIIQNGTPQDARQAYVRYAMAQKTAVINNPNYQTAKNISTATSTYSMTESPNLAKFPIDVLQVGDLRGKCGEPGVVKEVCSDTPMANNSQRTTEFQGLGILTLSPDGKTSYLTPFSDPMTGEFPWQAIYSDNEGIAPDFEPWFSFVVGKENTEAQKRTYLMRKLSIKSVPAFTTWMREWSKRAQMSPLPREGDYAWEWRWTLPANYPILPFNEQYKAYLDALTTWEGIVNFQLNMLRRLRQFNMLNRIGLAPPNSQYSSPDYDEEVQRVSYKEAYDWATATYKMVENPDQFINPHQYWAGKRVMNNQDVIPPPPAPFGILKVNIPIQSGLYEDPETGVIVNAYDDQGNALTQDQLNQSINVAREERNKELEAKAAEEKRIADEEAARVKLQEERRTKGQELSKQYEQEIQRQQTAIQANPTSKANQEFIQKVSKEYGSAEGFAKRHWFDVEAAKSGGQIYYFTKGEWEGTSLASENIAPTGQSFKSFMNNIFYAYYGNNNFDANGKNSVPSRQKLFEEAQKTTTDEAFLQVLGLTNGVRNSSDGKINRWDTYKEQGLIKDIDGSGKPPLEYWQQSNFNKYGFDGTKIPLPPTFETLPKEWIDRYNELQENNKKNFPDSYPPKKNMFPDGKYRGIPYKEEEITFKDVPQDRKPFFPALAEDAVMVKVSPGSSGTKMEDTAEYKLLIEAYADKDYFLRRFKATEWGVDESVTDQGILNQFQEQPEEGVFVQKKPGYYIPLMTFDEFLAHTIENLDDKSSSSFPSSTEIRSDPVREYIIQYLTLFQHDDTKDEPIRALGSEMIDVEKLKKTPDPAVASYQEVMYRIPIIQYPDAVARILTTEVSTAKTGSGRPKLKPRFIKGRGHNDYSSSSSSEEEEEYKPMPVPMELVYFTTPKKSVKRRSKKQVTKEHLEKLQEGRRKYQEAKLRASRLF